MARNLITLRTPPPDESALQAQLEETLVRELLHRTRSTGVSLLGVAFVIWMLVRPWTGSLVVGLFIALGVFTAIRVVSAIWLVRQPRERFRYMRAFYWFTAMTMLSGMSLALVFLASYEHVPSLNLAMILVCLVGVNSGALLSLALIPVCYWSYCAWNLLAVNYVAFVHPFPGLEQPFQIMQIVYTLALFVMVRTVHRSLRGGFVVRLQLASSLGELRDTQAKLVEASRQAGRADVATEVLHSVGNVLNSVNISASLVAELVARSRTKKLPKVVELITQHSDDLARFLRDDPRGQKLPRYFVQLAELVERDNLAVEAEVKSLVQHVDHIKVIVSSQQAQPRARGVVETFDVHDVVDDVLQLSAAEHEQAIEVVRRFDDLPPVRLDRHKVREILLILLANARDAVGANHLGHRRILIHARRDGNALEIAIEDNGCGIAPDDLERIFRQGFTTKPGGRGLGLHYSACAARELNGSLTAHSVGPGQGASFVLTLPWTAGEPTST